MVKKFKLTAKQREAYSVLGSLATHILLVGGSRSGKTFLIVRTVITRALKASNTRHAILRFRFNHCKASIVLDTFPKVMSLCFPEIKYSLDKTDWYASLPNGSQIWFGGLDDKQRTEKILGQEYVSIYLNETSQISKASRDMVVTRLAQKASVDLEGFTPQALKPRMYYDANPTNKLHWTYRLFIEKRDPETKQPLRDAENYAYFKMNPKDNAENLSEEYLATLESLPAHLRKRFLDGEYADATPNALFSDTVIDTWRVLDDRIPDMVRIVVAVDPSGSGDTDNADNDAIGICCVGLGTDGNAYLLEDATVKASPAVWGRVATDLFVRYDADVIVGEANYGGEMVKHVIQTARPRTPYKAVNATRGKVVRAEPFSSLYDGGKIRHVGYFPELEDELTFFTTTGYLGESSPNRADALIWALAELFRGIVQPRHENAVPANIPVWGPSSSEMGL